MQQRYLLEQAAVAAASAARRCWCEGGCRDSKTLPCSGRRSCTAATLAFGAGPIWAASEHFFCEPDACPAGCQMRVRLQPNCSAPAGACVVAGCCCCPPAARRNGDSCSKCAASQRCDNGAWACRVFVCTHHPLRVLHCVPCGTAAARRRESDGQRRQRRDDGAGYRWLLGANCAWQKTWQRLW